MKTEKRHMAQCYNTRANVQDHKLRLKLAGENSKGTSQEFVADMPFYFIPYFIDELRKAWKIEREYRTAEINRIDSSMPEEKPL
jgi:hypothetical protein